MRGLGGLTGRRRVYEAPKPQHYFHLEYKLLPDDTETVKTDIVTYGVAAKIYMETDSKVLKTWKEGGKTWIAWTHRYFSDENLALHLGRGYFARLRTTFR